MIPHCRKPIALASYPGSGNTWLRFLIEGAGGVFTGSRYKDLQIQMFGKILNSLIDYYLSQCFSTFLSSRHTLNQKKFGGTLTSKNFQARRRKIVLFYY